MKTTFKLLLFIVFILATNSTKAQKGLENTKYFILIEDTTTISINDFKNNAIHKIATYTYSPRTKPLNGSLWATDGQNQLVIINKETKELRLINFIKKTETKLKIPYTIQSKSVFLTHDNILIGGDKEQELFVQYNIKNKKWFSLEIPERLRQYGKSIDDIIISNDTIVAIDNIVLPKYLLFYKYNSNEKLTFLTDFELNNNGPYENYHSGRVTDKYFGLFSTTFSGYSGGASHLSIFKNNDMRFEFTISSEQQDSTGFSYICDFAILGDKIVFSSEKKGLGIYTIQDSDFKNSSSNNLRIDNNKILFKPYSDGIIEDITLIPKTNKVILTIIDEKMNVRNEVVEIND